MHEQSRLTAAIILTVLILYRSYRKRSLTANGCLAAFFVGTVLTASSFCHFSSLLTFFAISNQATRYRQDEKKKIDHDFKANGQRNAIQVFCNGACPVAFSLAYMKLLNGMGEICWDFIDNYWCSFCTCAVLVSFACSCGDTLASELGPVWGNRGLFTNAFHITKFKKVPKGTNGGVSVYGTLASIFGGFIVGFSYFLVLFLTNVQGSLSIWHYAPLLVGAISGLVGSMIDSVLGSIFQFSGFDEKSGRICNQPGQNVKHISGFNFLSNNQVNLISSLITSVSISYLTGQFFAYSHQN